MKNKAFTLIELLAVIVLLAIIAIIATPIILNIINESKEGANIRSAENYLSAVELTVAAKNLTEEFNPSVCSIQTNGDLVCGAIELKVDIENPPTDGILTFKNGKVISVEDIEIDGKTYSTNESGNIVAFDYDAQQGITPEECFETSTTRVVSFEPIEGSCPSSVRQISSKVNQTFTEQQAASICNGEEVLGISMMDLLNQPTILSELNGTAVTVTTEEMTGIKITGYKNTCKSKDIMIPRKIGGKKVEEIATIAFKQKSLTSVVMPNTIKTIGAFAFYGNQLTSITIPSSVTNLENWVFAYNKLASVTIPDNVTKLGSYAFFNSQLKSVTIGNGVTNIEYATFYKNNLTDLIIPNNITIIGGDSFRYNQLTNLSIGNGVTSIEANAFYGNKLANITIPDNVITIGSYAFAVNKLTSVSIGNGVTNIGGHAFAFNYLTNLAIPDNVVTIDHNAFRANELTSVRIGNGLTSIGYNAFLSSNNINDVNGMTYQENPNLSSIVVDNVEGSISGIWSVGAPNATITYLRS